MKRRTLLAGAAAGTALGFGLGRAAAQVDKVKAGFIYVGPIGDYGYSHQHNLGRLALEAAMPGQVETTYVESVPEGADAERVLTQMALAGTNIIFATSFGYMDAVINVAAKFPKVKFEHATGYKRADNVATYSARFYEGRAVIGTIAGMMTKANKVGYIASYPIPEVIRGINSAFVSARKVNKDVEFRVVWAYTWFDPAKEADAANALIEQGCDVIMQHTDSTAPMTIAEKKGIIAFGQASDMAAFGPTAQMTAIIDNWGPYYTARVKALMDGSWTSTDTWDGIAAGMVEFADFNARMPEPVAMAGHKLVTEIGSSAVKPFTGPLNKQDGSAWLAESETADDATLAGMSFYVEGLTGDIPS